MSSRSISLLVAIVALGSAMWLLRDSSPHVRVGDGRTAVADPITPGPSNQGECGYAWAYKDLPELSAQLQARLSARDDVTAARAEAFGEDCIHEDGRRTFLALETDYYFAIRVDSLAEPEVLGDWIAEVMEAIDLLPTHEIPGVRAGFVEYRFSEKDGNFRVLRVPISEYHTEASRLDDSALFERFADGQP